MYLLDSQTLTTDWRIALAPLRDTVHKLPSICRGRGLGASRSKDPIPQTSSLVAHHLKIWPGWLDPPPPSPNYPLDTSPAMKLFGWASGRVGLTE